MNYGGDYNGFYTNRILRKVKLNDSKVTNTVN